MSDIDRVLAAVVATLLGCFAIAAAGVNISWNTPAPLAVIVPVAGLVWVAIYNIAMRK